MPELPEVETVVQRVLLPLKGERFTSVDVSDKPLRRPWLPEWEPKLKEKCVLDVCRRGKWIVMSIEGGLYLAFHLGMSGQLSVVPAGEPRKHTHIVLGLKLGEQELRFRDSRRFGSATVFADQVARDRFFEEVGIGPEPFRIDPAYWRQRLAGTTRCLKAVLLDQRVVAGVGNIYADESLFEARLHPRRRGCDLTAGEADQLRKVIAAVLRRAIRKGGTTFDAAYLGGSYQQQLRVYGRTDKPCPECDTPIQRIRLAGRSTHYCPKCQRRRDEG